MGKILSYKFRRLLFLLIIYQIELSNGTSQVACVMSSKNKKCTISGLTLTTKNSSFVPVAPDSSVVSDFEISKSVVPVLTSDICTQFTKLNIFVASQQHVEVIEDYAFYNCTEIKNINLEKNNIHKVGKGVFSNAIKLQRLHILGASLDHIDSDWFSNLSELSQIVFSASGLKDLPLAAVKDLKKLQNLYIYSNDLSDLDVEGLVENLPTLKTIYINDNNFHCDRLIEMINYFKEKKITVHDHTFPSLLKKRDYIPRKINNIICLTEAQLQSEKLKKALTNSLEELKDLPIGKAVIELKDVVTTGFTDADSNIVELNEQISNLNETLQNTTTAIDDAVDDLKENISNQIVKQQILETKLQEIADSLALMMNKYNKLLDNLPANENSNQEYESLSNNVVAIWVFVVSLLLMNVAVSFFVYKRYKNVHVGVPILCYENKSDHILEYN